jgi:hypothetical protein
MCGGSELRKDQRRGSIGSAVCRVDYDFDAVKGELVWERRFDKRYVASGRIVQALGPPDACPRWTLLIEFGTENKRLNVSFHVIGELEPIRPENLDSVVLVGVVPVSKR